uniref:Uncharacterized protein n=1 Tax=Setaria italica TaxID=4555 RepID=K3Y3X3_SETIT
MAAQRCGGSSCYPDALRGARQPGHQHPARGEVAQDADAVRHGRRARESRGLRRGGRRSAGELQTSTPWELWPVGEDVPVVVEKVDSEKKRGWG